MVQQEKYIRTESESLSRSIDGYTAELDNMEL